MINASTSRTALITGASRGLGLALARGLAREGWNLVIDARGGEALETAREALSKLTQVVAVTGSVTDGEHRLALAREVHSFGGLDALINNASILGPSPQPALLDYPLDVLEEVYRVNTFAPLALIQAVRDELKPGAVVLNVTSDAGVEPYPGWGRVRLQQGRPGATLGDTRRREPISARLLGGPRRHAHPDAPGSVPRRGHRRPSATRGERSWPHRVDRGWASVRTLPDHGPRRKRGGLI